MAEDAGAAASAAPDGPGDAILPPPVPHGPGHTLRNILAIAGVLLILVVLVIGYMAAAARATADRVHASHAVLTRVDNHFKGFRDRFASATAGVDSTGGATFDMAKARGAVDEAASQMDGIRATDLADLRAVSAADAKVQDRGILTALSKSALDREHRRLDAYRRGLDAELAEIVPLKAQFAMLGDFLSTVEQLQTLSADTTAKNIAAAEKDYDKSSALLDKTMAAATASGDTPPKMKEFLAVFRSELTHIKGVLDAVRDKNPPRVRAEVALLQKDVDALKTFDTASLQQQYTDLGSKLDTPVKALFDQAR